MLRQNGNALFLVLIAVALFAALSFAVTQSSRTKGADPSRENTLLNAARIVEIGSNFKTAITRMRFSGIKLEDIDVHSGDSGNYMYSLTPCTTGEACVFAPEGGGMEDAQLHKILFGSPHTGKGGTAAGPTFSMSEISDNIIVDGIADNQPVIVILVWNLSEAACASLNKGLNIEGIPTGNSMEQVGSNETLTAAPGKYAACWENGAGDNFYTFYQVVGAP